MPRLKARRLTNAQLAAYDGQVGELLYNKTYNQLVVHSGLAGALPLANQADLLVLSQRVAHVESTATTNRTDLDSTQSTANEAYRLATSALSSASDSRTTALSALSAAQTAQETAAGAQETATAAQETATAAQETATAAQTAVAAMQATVADMTGVLATGLVNVLSYGAEASATVDNSPAIQAAIDYAHANGLPGVLIPAGVYGVNSTITLRSGVDVIAQGDVELYRMSASLKIFMIMLPQELTYTPDDNTYFGQENITVRGLRFNFRGPALNPSSGGCMGLCCAFAKDILIEDCTFLDRVGSHTMEVSGCYNFTVRNCRFLGGLENGTDDGLGYREHIQIEMTAHSGTRSMWNANMSNVVTSSRFITVEGCYFGPSDNLPAGATAVGTHSTVEDFFSACHVRILHCIFDRLQVRGVSFYVAYDYVVDGCTFYHCKQPCRFSFVRATQDRNKNLIEGDKAPDGIRFVNNWVEMEGDGYAVYTSKYGDEWSREEDPVDASDIISRAVISNNTFLHNSTTDGHLYLRFMDDIIITNNHFLGTTNVIANATFCSLYFAGNVCKGYTRWGIISKESMAAYPFSSHDYVITGNVFAGAFSTSGNEVCLVGNDGTKNATITNNVVRSTFTGTERGLTFYVKDWQNVRVFGNTSYITAESAPDMFSATDVASSGENVHINGTQTDVTTDKLSAITSAYSSKTGWALTAVKNASDPFIRLRPATEGFTPSASGLSDADVISQLLLEINDLRYRVDVLENYVGG